MEAFSGYKLQSVSGVTPSDGQAWNLDRGATGDLARINFKNVSSKCATCFNVKYARTTVVENIGPARIGLVTSNTSEQFYIHAGGDEKSTKSSSLLKGLSKDTSWLRAWESQNGELAPKFSKFLNFLLHLRLTLLKVHALICI